MCTTCDEIDWDPTTDKPEIIGSQFGVSFYSLPYDAKTVESLKLDAQAAKNVQFRIFSEDDEYWHYTGESASIHWLKDLINVLKIASKVKHA